MQYWILDGWPDGRIPGLFWTVEMIYVLFSSTRTPVFRLLLYIMTIDINFSAYIYAY